MNKKMMKVFEAIKAFRGTVQDALQYIEEEAESFDPELLYSRNNKLDKEELKMMLEDAAGDSEQFLDCVVFECEKMKESAEKLLDRLYKLDI